MNANSAAMPMISAVTPCSMFFWPSVAVMTFSLAIEIGAASAPPRNNLPSSVASFIERPVVWKRGPNTPWMVAMLMTFSSLMMRVTGLPLAMTGSPFDVTTSLRSSMKTTAIGLPRFARVVRSISSPPAPSSVTCTSGPLCPALAVALVSWLPVTMMSRLSITG